MANPFYQKMQQTQPMMNPIQNFMMALQQLKAGGGDPNQRIQQLLQSGQVTQEQYNQAVEKAKQLQQMIGRR